MSAAAGQITVLLRAVQEGRPGAKEELIGLIYNELRRIAYRQSVRHPFRESPQPTILVHEAFLRLFGDASASWENRRHFFWAAARAMRDILVDEARRCTAQKRGGKLRRTEFLEHTVLETQSQELIELDDALARLAESVPEAADVVTLRFFGGLTYDEIAPLLDLSTATVRRRWEFAKVWLRRELSSALC